VRAARCGAAPREAVDGATRAAGAARAPARMGDDRGARRDDGGESLLPDDAVLLLLRVRGAGARAAGRVRETRSLKVAVLTTSYPRGPGDVAGLFVRDAVEHVRERGVEVEV